MSYRQREIKIQFPFFGGEGRWDCEIIPSGDNNLKCVEEFTSRKIQRSRNKDRRQNFEEHLHFGGRQRNKKKKEFCQVVPK